MIRRFAACFDPRAVLRGTALAALLGMAFAPPLWAQTDEETAGEAPAEPAPTEAPSAETVLATVNGRDITLGEVIALRMSLPQQYQTLPDEVLYEGILEQLIDQSLLEEIGRTNGLDARSDVVLRILNQRRSLIAQAQLLEELAIRLTDERIEALYTERFLGAEPVVEVRARHILLETREDALRIKAEIDAGADFADMAVQHSTGPSGPNGGDLGYFVHSQMVPEFADAAYALEVGAVSDPVESQFGWHLIKLEDRRDQAPPPLAAVREELVLELEQQISSEIVEELREDAAIERLPQPIPPALIRADDLLRR